MAQHVGGDHIYLVTQSCIRTVAQRMFINPDHTKHNVMHAKYTHFYTTYLYCAITVSVVVILSYRPIVGLMHSCKILKFIYLSHHMHTIMTMTSYSTTTQL